MLLRYTTQTTTGVISEGIMRKIGMALTIDRFNKLYVIIQKDNKDSEYCTPTELEQMYEKYLKNEGTLVRYLYSLNNFQPFTDKDAFEKLKLRVGDIAKRTLLNIEFFASLQLRRFVYEGKSRENYTPIIDIKLCRCEHGNSHIFIDFMKRHDNGSLPYHQRIPLSLTEFDKHFLNDENGYLFLTSTNFLNITQEYDISALFRKLGHFRQSF